MPSFKEGLPRSAPQSPEIEEFKIFKNSGHKRSLSQNHFNNSSFIIESERDINTNPYTPPSNRTPKRREEIMVVRSKYTTGIKKKKNFFYRLIENKI